VADFHTYTRFSEPLDQWTHEPAVVAVHSKPEGAYQVRFSHADLAPNNILVDPKQGKITGIIDWEFGGWYPEYWEYTKMYYGGVRPGWERWFAAIVEEDGIEKYKAERKAEEAIWLRAGPFGYV
jgi:thiamine kinase-like enzyme